MKGLTKAETTFGGGNLLRVPQLAAGLACERIKLFCGKLESARAVQSRGRPIRRTRS